MVKLLILRGVPASGKSTFAKEWVLAGNQPRVRLNRDNLRWSNGIREGVGEFQQEQLISVLQKAQAREALRLGYDVVVDDTNLRAKFVKEWLKLAAEAGAEVEFKDFEIDLTTALWRDAHRDKYVGKEVIESYFTRFIRKGNLPDFPVLEKNTGHVFAPYVPNTKLPKAVLVDTDGTVATFDKRGPYDTSLYHTDLPVPNVIEVVNILHNAGVKIIGMSGRSAEFREVTEQWWRDKGVPFDEFYMRYEGDMRKDSIVKSELFDAFIAYTHNVLGVIDDRLQVARMWHQKGVTLFKVGDPDADF